MNNWLYTQEVPTTAWRSAMTIPRLLTRHETPNGLKVFSNPIGELDGVNATKQSKSKVHIATKTSLNTLFGDLPSSHHVYPQISKQQAKRIQISYLNQKKETAVTTLDVEANKVTIECTKSGIVDFQENFTSTQYGPIGANLDVYSLDIFYDKTSLELFINQGKLVMTAQVFLNAANDEIEISADNAVMLNTSSIAKIIS
jgi:fructan beta-fructosidase